MISRNQFRNGDRLNYYEPKVETVTLTNPYHRCISSPVAFSKASLLSRATLSYTLPGNYAVSSVATNTKGRADTAVRIVKIFPIREPDAGSNSVICLGAVFYTAGESWALFPEALEFTELQQLPVTCCKANINNHLLAERHKYL